MPQRPAHLCFIGFGEAATAFLSGWDIARPAHITAYDRKTDIDASRALQLTQYAAHRVTPGLSLKAALQGADTVFCLVTADEACAAARAAAPYLAKGALWFDGNSCAPSTKRQAAAVIEAAGGRYVDLAIMSPVHPLRHHAPLLIAGSHTDAANAALQALDMKPRAVGAEVGRASAIKMIRSVMVKGLEALTAECLLSAHRAGVADEVLASLTASHPGIAWPRQGAYNLERMMVHGTRRAAEMREVAITIADLGLGGEMAAATALWQDRIADSDTAPGADDLALRAAALLARI